VPGTTGVYRRENAPIRNAQGIEAVYFFAAGKKDTSGKPGPGAIGARMRPKSKYYPTGIKKVQISQIFLVVSRCEG
jgi:hypothetical protein